MIEVNKYLQINKEDFKNILSLEKNISMKKITLYKSQLQRIHNELDELALDIKDNPILYIKSVKELTKEDKEYLFNKAQEKVLEEYKDKFNRYKLNFEDLTDADFDEIRKDLYDSNALTTKEELFVEKQYFETLITYISDVINQRTVFILDRDELTSENLLIFKKFALEVLKMGRQVELVIYKNMKEQFNDSKVNYVFSDEEFKLLDEFNYFLIKHNCKEIQFNESELLIEEEDLKNNYDYKTIKDCNRLIDNIASKIKKRNFSPFEAMVYIHRYLSTHYNYNNSGVNDFVGRVLPSVYKNQYIVCSGYSTLVKAIIDKLNNENLTAQYISPQYYDKNNYQRILIGHSQDLIYIKDEKYDIEGYYVEDVTADSISIEYKTDGYNSYGFSGCLISLNTLKYNLDSFYDVNLNEKYRYGNIILGCGPKILKNHNFDSKFYQKYLSKSPVIAIQSYKRAINYIYKEEIEKGKLDLDLEICKTRKKIKKDYGDFAVHSFMSPEERLLYEIFNVKK